MAEATELAGARSADADRETDRAQAASARWFWLALAILLSSAYMAAHLTQGWIPVDDGTLAQSALRVLHGELPHRDFAEVYTGGLSRYHALAFRIFGVKLMALRYAVFLVFVPWLAAIYYVARRFARPMAAAGVVLLCATWSLPCYPAAMPSWYNLFLATFGAAAILRYIDTRRWHWLLVAGVCGGVSLDVKIIGLYYIAAVLLWFVYREQEMAPTQVNQRRVSAYSLFVFVGLAGFLATVAWLFRNQFGSTEAFHFFLPAAAVAVLLVHREWRLPLRAAAARFATLFAMVGPFAAGVLLPIVVLVYPYWRSSSVSALVRGVFVRGGSAVTALAVLPSFGPWFALFAAPTLLLLGIAMFRKQPLSWLQLAFLAAAMAAALIAARLSFMAGLYSWLSVATITPLIVVAGVYLLDRRFDCQPSERRQAVFLLLSLAAICSLVEFPFSAPIYLHYHIPLTALALGALLSFRRSRSCDFVLAALMVFYTIFAMVFAVPATLYQPHMDLRDRRQPMSVSVGQGLKVVDAGVYGALAQSVNEHANGKPILAFNECPEVFFLTGRANLISDDSFATPDQVKRAIERDEVSVIVLNPRPYFPGSIPGVQTVQEIFTRFPNSQRIGNYLVRWR